MLWLDVALILSILSCSLVAGFIFTFAIVVMPGISKLNDKDFIRAFQVTDAVIQNNQPLFMVTWVGSIVAMLLTILVSLGSLGFSEAWPIVLVCFLYLLGVQGITIIIHIPMNRQIQKLKIKEANYRDLANERLKFERRWNFFNHIRAGIAISVSLLLLVILSLR